MNSQISTARDRSRRFRNKCRGMSFPLSKPTEGPDSAFHAQTLVSKPFSPLKGIRFLEEMADLRALAGKEQDEPGTSCCVRK